MIYEEPKIIFSEVQEDIICTSNSNRDDGEIDWA